MELVSNETEQLVTPGTPFTAFSTLAWQAAQLIPVTVYFSISLHLLHQFLKHIDQLINGLILPFADIIRDA